MAKGTIDIHMTEEHLRAVLKPNTKAELIDDVIVLIGELSESKDEAMRLRGDTDSYIHQVKVLLDERTATSNVNHAQAKTIASQQKTVEVMTAVVERLLK